MKILTLILSSLFLVACGVSSNNSGDGNPTTLTGVFLDSPVINVDYRTQTQSGTTNLQGEYQYLADETVTFTIGNLKFPPVKADSTVTPLDMAGTQTITADAVVNMIRLLQSLDKDGNPANGIEITDTAKQAASSVSFSQSTPTFAAEINIVNLVSGGGQDTPIGVLITEASAIANFIIGLGRTTSTFSATSTVTATINPTPVNGSTGLDNPAFYGLFCNRDNINSLPNENVGDTATLTISLIIDNTLNKVVYNNGYGFYSGKFTKNGNILFANLEIIEARITTGDDYFQQHNFNIELMYNTSNQAFSSTEINTVTNSYSTIDSITCKTTREITTQ